MADATETAKAYASAGWYVFPLRPGEREPYGGVSWKAISTNDAKQIEALSDQYPGCNWGVDCGKSGLMVLDVDMKNGKDGEQSLAELNISTKTFTVATPSNGRHLYYVGEGKTGKDDLGKGLDTRSTGGYVVIPGSVCEGKSYRIVDDSPLQPMPDKMAQILATKKADPERRAQVLCDLDLDHNVDTAINYLTNTAPEALQGDRDNTCYEVACRIRDFGISREKARELIQEYYVHKVQLTSDFSFSELDWKVRSAYQYARNPVGISTPEALFPEIPQVHRTGFKHVAADIDPKEIKPRPWIMQDRLLHGYLTLTAAPGGVGKSLQSILEGMSVATGKNLTHYEVKEQCNVWYYNTEDPNDELDRRIDAARRYHGLKRSDLKNFYYSSGYHTPLKLAGLDDKGRPIVYENIVQWLIGEIQENDIQVLIIDPLVEIHGLNENSNTDMPVLMQALRRIADETQCAISIVHHTSQGNDNAVGNADKSRGATAIPNACRITHTLYTMTARDADRYNIPEDIHWWYVRMDQAKQNLSRPGINTKWYRRVSVEGADGESTGTLELEHLDEVENASETCSVQDGLRALIGPGQYMTIHQAAKRLIENKTLTCTINTAKRKIRQAAETGFFDGELVWTFYEEPNRSGGQTAAIQCSYIVR